MRHSKSEGLFAAFILDGQGRGQPLDWQGVRGWQPGQGLLWVHLDYTVPQARHWLVRESGLDGLVSGALLAEEPRPRAVASQGALLLFLRGINLNPGAEPDDMVALRLWTDGQRVITTLRRRLLASKDLIEAIERGDAPHQAGEFLADLTEMVVHRIADVVDDVDEELDQMEDEMVAVGTRRLHEKLGELRRKAINLRRYLGPQREALAHLQVERLAWLGQEDRLRLREIQERVTHFIEELDATRDRAAITQEELISRLNARLEERMYNVSLIATVFLPLTFITGLLGINVGGIPGSENPKAFWLVCGVILLVGAVQVWFFKKRRWL